jgi:hypothetical protein
MPTASGLAVLAHFRRRAIIVGLGLTERAFRGGVVQESEDSDLRLPVSARSFAVSAFFGALQ